MALLLNGKNPAALKSTKRIYFTATASQTTFNISDGYSVGDVEVYMNGLRLTEGDDYTATNGSDIILTSGANVGDSILVTSYNQFLTSNSYTKAESDNKYLALTGGTLTSYLRTPNYGVSSYSDSATASLEASAGLGEQGVGIKAFGRSVATNGGDILYTADNRGAGGRHRFGYWNGTSFVNTLTVDSLGRVTKPLQPLFSGYITTTSHPPVGVLPVNTTYNNVGNYWNTSTYTFTCPVAGYYHMHGSFMTDSYTAPSSATGITNIDPQKNGTAIGPKWYTDLNSVSYQIRFSGDCIVQAAAGDTLRFYLTNGKIHKDAYNEFFIRLIG